VQRAVQQMPQSNDLAGAVVALGLARGRCGSFASRSGNDRNVEEDGLALNGPVWPIAEVLTSWRYRPSQIKSRLMVARASYSLDRLLPRLPKQSRGLAGLYRQPRTVDSPDEHLKIGVTTRGDGHDQRSREVSWWR
jgi:hypothetical protein